MDDEIIEINDYEVKEKSEVIGIDDNDDDYSEGTRYDNSSNNSSNNSYTSTYSASLSGGALIIIGLVAIILVAIFVLTIC